MLTSVAALALALAPGLRAPAPGQQPVVMRRGARFAFPLMQADEAVEEAAQMEEEKSEEEFIDEEDSDEDASDEEAWETGRIPVGFQVNRVAPRRSGRNRRAPQRYKDEHYAELILEDIPSSDIDDILNDSSE